MYRAFEQREGSYTENRDCKESFRTRKNHLGFLLGISLQFRVMRCFKYSIRHGV